MDTYYYILTKLITFLVTLYVGAMKKTSTSPFVVAAFATSLFTAGCTANEIDTQDTNLAPLVAVGDDGETGLVGYFDTATGEVTVTPSLVSASLKLASESSQESVLLFMPSNDAVLAYEISPSSLSVMSSMSLMIDDTGRICIVTADGVRWTVVQFRVESPGSTVSDDFVPATLKREYSCIDADGNVYDSVTPCLM